MPPCSHSPSFPVTMPPYRHGVVRVEDSESDLYAAVDLVADKLKRKLVKVRVGLGRVVWPSQTLLCPAGWVAREMQSALPPPPHPPTHQPTHLPPDVRSRSGLCRRPTGPGAAGPRYAH